MGKDAELDVTFLPGLTMYVCLSMKSVLIHICDMCDHKIVYLDYTKTVFLMAMSSIYGQNQRLYLPPNLVEIIFHILDNFR